MSLQIQKSNGETENFFSEGEVGHLRAHLAALTAENERLRAEAEAAENMYDKVSWYLSNKKSWDNTSHNLKNARLAMDAYQLVRATRLQVDATP